MTSEQDLDGRLRDLGRTPGPPVDAAFAEALDARLRILHVEQQAPGSARAWWLAPLVALSVTVITVVGVLFIGSRPPDDEVVMTAAADTEVIGPDGVSMPASAGLVLVEGTRIIVGPDGEAVVDGVVLGPGSAAVVVGDRLDVVDTGTDAAADDPEQRDDEVDDGVGREAAGRQSDDGRDDSAGGRDRSGEPERADPGSQPTDTSAATTTSALDRPTTAPSTTGADRPTTTGGPTTAGSTPATSPTTRPTASSTSGSSVPTTSGERPSPVMLQITGVGENRLRLDWTLDGDLPPAGWRVRLGEGDRVATLVVIRRGDARSTTIEGLGANDVMLWVEALDDRGRILAASRPVAPPGS